MMPLSRRYTNLQITNRNVRTVRHSRDWRHIIRAPLTSPHSGQILLLVILLLSAILSISLSIFNTVFAELQISGEMSNSFKALYAADEGMEKLSYDDRVTNSVPGCSGASPCTYPASGGLVQLPELPSGACARVRLVRLGGGATTITSVGEYRCASPELVLKRALQATYTVR